MKTSLRLLVLFISVTGWTQDTLSEVLKKYNSQTIPYISVNELAMPKTQALILDAREFTEYEVSHIKGAKHVGYEEFNLEHTMQSIEDKSHPIVVYCTLGIRSEDIAERLKAAGYTNVKNLYGGIVEWKNKDFEVIDMNGIPTENVHVFDAYWSQWLIRGIKVYD